MRLVTVRGRMSGKEYSTPFWLLERPDGRYWVSVFGETNTIKNARAAGHVTVSRGTARDEVRLVEVPVEMRQRESGRSSITAFRSLYYMGKVSLALFVGLLRPRPVQ